MPAAGVPLSEAPLKVTPEGSVPPVSAMVGAGVPEAVTLKAPAEVTVKVVAVPLVNAGAAPPEVRRLLTLTLVSAAVYLLNGLVDLFATATV